MYRNFLGYDTELYFGEEWPTFRKKNSLSVLKPEDGASVLLQNVDIHLLDYKTML
jgi:hypothetical protein